jgi:ABC-type nickel/cobalt efflux system permease component RcnA
VVLDPGAIDGDPGARQGERVVRGALAAVGLSIVFVLIFAPAAGAHPLGNFTVNRSAEVVIAPGRITIRYALDLAEIPAYQTLRELAPDGDPRPEELQRWADRTAREIAAGMIVRIDGRRVSVEVEGAVPSVASGQAGLRTLRLDARLGATVDASSGRLAVADRNEPSGLGWREIVARGAGGFVLVGCDVPTISITDRLRAYPEDLLSAPVAVSSMRARFEPGSDPASPATTTDRPMPASAGPGVLDRLVARRGTIVMLLGLVIAVAAGAWHALLPGHGKTLTAAAVVDADARPRDAIAASLSVAGMHTVSVIALGVVIVALERTFRPEAVYPWLRAASGMAAVGMGVHLIRRRWRSGAHPPHVHPHDPGDASGHRHDRGDDPRRRSLSAPGLAALALAGGILPSPSAVLVLLASVQRGRALYGLALVVAFSIGLAAALILVALGVMRARRLAERRAWNVMRRAVPVASAFAIVAIGLVVAGDAVTSL